MAPSDDDLLAADLDEYLAIEVPVAEDELDDDGAPAVTAPPDELMADKLLYKARRMKEELDQHRAFAEARKAEIDAWLADRTSGTARELTRIEKALDLFMWRWHRSHPKSGKTLTLPNGRLKLVKRRAKLVIQDEHLLIAWAQEHGRTDLLRPEWKVRRDDIAALAKDADHRAKGPQESIEDSKGRPYLAQGYKVLAEVPATTEGAEPGQHELATIPGVIYAEPIDEDADSFTYDTDLTNDNEESA